LLTNNRPISFSKNVLVKRLVLQKKLFRFVNKKTSKTAGANNFLILAKQKFNGKP